MDVVETMKRLDELRERRETLASRERELDEQQRRMEQCLRNITDDTINEQYPTFTQKFIDSRIWGLCWNRVRSSGVCGCFILSYGGAYIVCCGGTCYVHSSVTYYYSIIICVVYTLVWYNVYHMCMTHKQSFCRDP